MNSSLWNTYMESLQGHPTRCRSEVSSDLSVFDSFIKSSTMGDFNDKSAPLLILGCADGRENHLFAERGHTDILGVTLGEVNVEAAKKDYPDATVMAADISTLDFLRSEHYRYVYCNQTFEHFYAPVITCLEIWLSMQNHGLWYIEYPGHDSEGHTKLTDPTTRYLSHHHPNLLRLEDALRLLQVCGFDIIKSECNDNNKILARKLPINQLKSNGVHDNVISTLRSQL